MMHWPCICSFEAYKAVVWLRATDTEISTSYGPMLLHNDFKFLSSDKMLVLAVTLEIKKMFVRLSCQMPRAVCILILNLIDC